MAMMTAEHWRAAFVATLCQVTNASPDEAEVEADRLIATIDPPIPDDLDVILHLGTAERAALATADRWRRDEEAQAGLFDDDEHEVEDLSPDAIPGEEDDADIP